MTKQELEKTHPDYQRLAGQWQFYMRSYFGGSLYREGDYLLRHPFESNANYARRKEISYYYNYCGPIVDIFVSHLFRHPAKRDFGRLAKDPLFGAFLKDADLDGSSFTQFMREAQRLSSIYGRVSILVDRPPVQALTKAEAMEFDIRPYTALVTPENLLDWAFTRQASGKPVLDMVKIREEGGVYRVWTREGWELWTIDPETEETRLVGRGVHALGRVPLVNLYNKRSGRRMIGLSDIQDIADINKNIYYLCSDAKEIIENTAFPMLALPYDKGVGKDKEVGPRNILQFDPEAPNARPFWLEAPHSSLSEIREWVRQDIEEIHRMAKMGGVKATEGVSVARSAAAMELEYQQLHSTLSEKADNLEQAETEILGLWSAWEGSAFDGSIDYPDDFSIRDLERDLEKAIGAQSARVMSATFQRELQKKIAELVFPKLDNDTKAAIAREIEANDANGQGA